MFQLIYVGMQEINQGHGILNVPEVAGKMLWKRRHLILKQDQLKSCYETILYYAQDVLAKGSVNKTILYYAQDLLAKGSVNKTILYYAQDVLA
ncbi:hypothetical protein DPMN_185304 [Dreissena polymorpha]|uniref:Uncharacterized protein n=1 Tax=Dreissena polymorpha TaxID=45954 RepID=A0A9D4I888_DREPO|nr:hypothetical protein DPMN_185304 [Dreissena polymorpha]